VHSSAKLLLGAPPVTKFTSSGGSRGTKNALHPIAARAGRVHRRRRPPSVKRACARSKAGRSRSVPILRPVNLTQRLTERKRNSKSSPGVPMTSSGADALAVVDCGGTNVRLALARAAENGRVVLDDIATYEDDAFPAFDDAFASYLGRVSSRPAAAAVAVA